MNDWEQRYQQGETGWDRGMASPAIEHWLNAVLKAPARILIPGCGRGHEAVFLASYGFDVTGIDIATSAVRHLEEQLAAEGLKAEVILGDLFAYQPDKPFDVVYEQTCLCALDPSTWPAYVQRLRGWLRPGGDLFAQFMQTGREGGPPFHCEVGQMRGLFAADAWAWADDPPLRVDHPNGLHELGYRLTCRG